MSDMIGKKTYRHSEYDHYKGKDPRGITNGQHFETKGEKSLYSVKTKSEPIPAKSHIRMGISKHKLEGVTRPDHQRADTISGASLGKAPGWTTHGDRKKAIKARIIQRRQYSMNHIAVARIMKGNVNANEGAYLHRGGNGMA